ncbi:MAG: thiamine pyrophosphate-dependent enzyme, partial [Ilumatobacteraceae bacterium]
RHLDRMARELRAREEGYYTIGASGHEAMAAIATAFRPTDMAFLHYRDAAFQIARAAQVDGQDPAWDMLLSFVSSADDPISGGRHKVLGSKPLAIPPQTSTIASHLPKAVGAAYSIGLAKRARPQHQVLPDDAVVVCSLGDASVNHASAQSAFNTAGWCAHRGVALPLVFVCEDNGLGISVPTPTGWIEATMSGRAGLDYAACNGLDVVDAHRVAQRVVADVRRTRRPAFVHLSCVRLFGHAGADVESVYRSQAEIDADTSDDPLLHTARILVEHAGLGPHDVVALYRQVDDDLRARVEEAVARPKLRTAEQVMARIVPPPRAVAATRVSPEERQAAFGAADLRSMDQPQPMAKLIGWALADLLLDHPEVVVAGQDVGLKGGVYGVTQRLQQRFGPTRVIDTLLDEQSILGLAIGLAHNGFVPIPEIQFLAYLHNAEDQLRGEAATLPFFSDGQFANPMVVRIPGLAYQRGFGGHFHNDNSLAVLRDIPGLIVACPSNGLDAVLMLRECVRLAREEQRVVVFVEPIARYTTRDLHATDDGGWAHRYPRPSEEASVRLGEVSTAGAGTDLAIVTYGNGSYLSVQAAGVLSEAGIGVRVVDLRWLAPLPVEAILAETAGCAAVLVVDECRATGSASEGLMTMFAERTSLQVARLCAEDSFIATGPAAAVTLPSRDSIVSAARKVLSRG